MKWMAKDFWTRVSRNKVSTLFTILMLSILLIVSTLTLSYCIDLPIQRDEDTTLYPLGFRATDAQQSEQITLASGFVQIDLSSIVTIQEIVKEYQNLQSVTYMRSSQVAFLLPDSLFTQVRSENRLEPFLADPYYRPVVLTAAQIEANSSQVEGLQKSDKTETHPLVDEPLLAVTALELDESAARFFGIEVAAGRTWNPQDFIREKESDPIPVIMGSAYQGIVSLNDTILIDNERTGAIKKIQVIGFLPENRTISHVNYDNTAIVETVADSSILFPIYSEMKTISMSDTLDIQQTYMVGSLVYAPKELPNAAFFKAQNEVKDISVRNGYTPVLFGNPSFGTVYFQLESDATMNALYIITILTNLFFICVMSLQFIGEINKNDRKYSIKMMLGMPPRTIVACCLVEVLAIFLLPTIFSILYFWKQIWETPQFLKLLALAHLSFAAIASIVLLYSLQKIKLTMTIKEEE